ncbi:MAG: dTMP kinase [Minicystis sp.]
MVLEGIDGSGTTTQAERYAQHLRAQRRLVHVTHEPSTGPIGTQIRLVLRQRLMMPATHQPEAMALLFAADRLDHVAAEIDPLLRDGYVVLSDRYDLSSLAYQSITAAQVSTDAPPSQRVTTATVEWIRELNRFARRPHVTVVLDVSPNVAASRRRSRGGVAEMYEEAELQARLAEAYKRAEDLLPNDRIIHIDGDRSPDIVAAAIEEALRPFVSPRS